MLLAFVWCVDDVVDVDVVALSQIVECRSVVFPQKLRPGCQLFPYCFHTTYLFLGAACNPACLIIYPIYWSWPSRYVISAITLSLTVASLCQMFDTKFW